MFSEIWHYIKEAKSQFRHKSFKNNFYANKVSLLDKPLKVKLSKWIIICLLRRSTFFLLFSLMVILHFYSNLVKLSLYFYSVSSKLCMFLDKDLLKLNHLIIPAHYTNKEERPFAVRTGSYFDFFHLLYEQVLIFLVCLILFWLLNVTIKNNKTEMLYQAYDCLTYYDLV